MFVKVSAIFLILAVAYSSQADVIEGAKGVGQDIGDWFSKQYHDAKDLFSSDQSELEKNVEKVKELLTNLKDKMNSYLPSASEAQKATLNKVDEYLAKINEFQAEVREEGGEKFEENKVKWQKMVDDIFNKGGLSNVIRMSSSQTFAVSAIVAPIFYMIFVR